KRIVKMENIKRMNKVILSFMLVVVMFLTMTAFASTQTYWGNDTTVKVTKLINESWFTPSVKTPSTSPGGGIKKNSHIRSGWVRIVEGNDNSYNSSKAYSKSHTSLVTVSTSQANNPIKGQTFTNGWTYN
ncbi:MAG: hypothetical protein ACRCUS_09425, partial [Anaerovoracaceae bacterium]